MLMLKLIRAWIRTMRPERGRQSRAGLWVSAIAFPGAGGPRAGAIADAIIAMAPARANAAVAMDMFRRLAEEPYLSTEAVDEPEQTEAIVHTAQKHFPHLAILARAMINDHPEDYAVYGQQYFTYNNIRQMNRNELLGEMRTSVGGNVQGYGDYRRLLDDKAIDAVLMRIVDVGLSRDAFLYVRDIYEDMETYEDLLLAAEEEALDLVQESADPEAQPRGRERPHQGRGTPTTGACERSAAGTVTTSSGVTSTPSLNTTWLFQSMFQGMAPLAFCENSGLFAPFVAGQLIHSTSAATAATAVTNTSFTANCVFPFSCSCLQDLIVTPGWAFWTAAVTAGGQSAAESGTRADGAMPHASM